jgi:hypothetical protein
MLDERLLTPRCFLQSASNAKILSAEPQPCIARKDTHYTPFPYYLSTLNAHPLPPTSPGNIGERDQANGCRPIESPETISPYLPGLPRLPCLFFALLLDCRSKG